MARLVVMARLEEARLLQAVHRRGLLRQQRSQHRT